MTTSEDDNKRPVQFLIGTIIVGVLVLVASAILLRKPPSSDPFDAPAPAPVSAEPTGP